MNPKRPKKPTQSELAQYESPGQHLWGFKICEDDITENVRTDCGCRFRFHVDWTCLLLELGCRDRGIFLLHTVAFWDTNESVINVGSFHYCIWLLVGKLWNLFGGVS